MDQVILKSWEEKSPHKRPILQMRKLRLRRIKFQPGFQAGLVDCRPLLSAGALFLPPGQAGLQSLHTPSPRCIRKGWRGPGGGRPSGGVPSTAHGVSGKTGVAPGAGAPQGVSQAQPTVSQERLAWPRGRAPLRGCPKHRFLRVPENPFQAAYTGGTRCLGWCACGGHILQERQQFHFDLRGPAQPKGCCVKPGGPRPHQDQDARPAPDTNVSFHFSCACSSVPRRPTPSPVPLPSQTVIRGMLRPVHPVEPCP